MTRASSRSKVLYNRLLLTLRSIGHHCAFCFCLYVNVFVFDRVWIYAVQDSISLTYFVLTTSCLRPVHACLPALPVRTYAFMITRFPSST